MSWFHAARTRVRLMFALRAAESLRDGRGLAWLGGLSLDLRLGLRMLAKYPGLTIVGVVGIAVAVAISTTAFRILDTVVDPTPPHLIGAASANCASRVSDTQPGGDHNGPGSHHAVIGPRESV